jgi:glycosyltransferase involved in cell wall biosynthesis
MRILFVTNNKYLPYRVGGSESSTHELCKELIKRGHEVAVVSSVTSNLRPRKWFSRKILKNLIRRTRFLEDHIVGYPVYRGRIYTFSRCTIGTGVSELKRKIRPDVAIVQAGKQVFHAAAWESVKIPVIIYLHDVNFKILGGDPRNLKHTRFISNSLFTAIRYKNEFGISSEVVLNIIEPERYRIGREENRVTFINPCELKGDKVAFQIAERLPWIPFLFVEGWPMNDEQYKKMNLRIKESRNIEWMQNTLDMKSVYKRTRILLVPSQCEEAWGRVVAEAQLNGIPVLASNIGGLPESVGRGGVLLDANTVDKWVLELKRLWSDKQYYSELSNNALAHSRRDEIKTASVIKKFLQIAQKTVNNHDRY